MKKLRGQREQKVEKLAKEYLRSKKKADEALKQLKEELKNEGECETDSFIFKNTLYQSNRFDKKELILRYGEEVYNECLKQSEARRFTVREK